MDNASARSIDPIASAAASTLWGRFNTALTAAAVNGSAGISQRYSTMLFIRRAGSPFHGIDLIHVCGVVVAINRNDQGQSNSGLRRRNTDGKDDEQNAGQRFRMGSVTPKRDEIQVRRIQHQLDADE